MTEKRNDPPPKDNAFVRTLAALAAVPKAEIDALEEARPKRPKRARADKKPVKKSAR